MYGRCATCHPLVGVSNGSAVLNCINYVELFAQLQCRLTCRARKFFKILHIIQAGEIHLYRQSEQIRGSRGSRVTVVTARTCLYCLAVV